RSGRRSERQTGPQRRPCVPHRLGRVATLARLRPGSRLSHLSFPARHSPPVRCRAFATPSLPLSSTTSPHAFQQELVHVYTVLAHALELRNSVDRGCKHPSFA